MATRIISFFGASMVFLAMMTTIAGCSDLNATGSKSNKDEKKQTTSALETEINVTLDAIRRLESDIDSGLLLSETTSDQKAKFQDLIYGLKASLYLLRKTPDSEPAAKELQAQHDALAATSFLGQDKSRFQELLNLVARVLNQLATTFADVGVKVALYEEQFKLDMGLFQSYTVSGAALWEMDTKRGFVKASGHKIGPSETWLISPAMDLSRAKEPTLVVSEAVNFLTEWSDLTVLWSTTYSSGDPTMAEWSEVPLSPRPNGDSWSFTKSNPIDLSGFDGGNLVVAFRYKNPSEKNAATWELNLFAIHGIGTLATTPVDFQGGGKPSPRTPGPTPAPKPEEGPGNEQGDATTLVTQGFDTDLGTFTTWSGASDVQWAQASRNGDSYARVSGFRKDPATVWLLSPVLDLTAVTEPTLEVTQSVGFLTDWSQFKLVVSLDFTEGDPNAATWQELSVANRPAFEPYWVWVESEAISLGEYAGKKIVLGFQYSSTEASQPTWQIDKVELKGKQ